MAKKPTPKRRHPKSRAKARYSKFQFEARRRLENGVNLVECSNCKGMRMSHHACPNCGFYRGRMVIDKSAEVKSKIKTISA
ncbi:MAG: 50S ribosomal protein L32 [Candidatus Altimarinota bacterium]